MYNNKFKIIYVASKVPKQDAIDITNKLCQELPVEFTRVETVQQIFPLLSNFSEDIDSVAIDIDDLYNTKGADYVDIIHTLHTLIHCTFYKSTTNSFPVKRMTKICAIIPDDISKSILKEILSLDEISDIALRFGGRVDYSILKRCIENHISDKCERTPKFIFDFIKSSESKKGKSGEIKLTTRQQQIFNIITTRGSSNKHIAKILSISESTVKLHVGALLKKYNVRNRTQLILFSDNKIKIENYFV